MCTCCGALRTRGCSASVAPRPCHRPPRQRPRGQRPLGVRRHSCVRARACRAPSSSHVCLPSTAPRAPGASTARRRAGLVACLAAGLMVDMVTVALVAHARRWRAGIRVRSYCCDHHTDQRTTAAAVAVTVYTAAMARATGVRGARCSRNSHPCVCRRPRHRLRRRGRRARVCRR